MKPHSGLRPSHLGVLMFALSGCLTQTSVTTDSSGNADCACDNTGYATQMACETAGYTWSCDTDTDGG
ncbi:MAG: hypothetical protein ACPHRO_08690, partial [Nannocystaceae bacterium]